MCVRGVCECVQRLYGGSPLNDSYDLLWRHQVSSDVMEGIKYHVSSAYGCNTLGLCIETRVCVTHFVVSTVFRSSFW